VGTRSVDYPSAAFTQNKENAMPKPVTFFSEEVKLAGDLYVPANLARGEKRAGIVLCHGYTGVRNIYLPDNARAL
jgi:uncharacterized protein